jgi:hypothetical protein
MPRFVNAGNILEPSTCSCGVDVLVAVRMIYYLRDRIDEVFAAAARHIPIDRAVRQPQPGRCLAPRPAARAARRVQPLCRPRGHARGAGAPRLSHRDEVDDGDEIVVGRR